MPKYVTPPRLKQHKQRKINKNMKNNNNSVICYSKLQFENSSTHILGNNIEFM